MIRTALAAALLSAAATGPAAAQAGPRSHPRIHPLRDVAVTYRVHGTVGPDKRPESGIVRMFWSDRGTLLRVELQGQPGWGILNFAAKQMIMVIAPAHRYLEMPLDPARTPGLNIPPGTATTRVGHDIVAGTPCTVWVLHGPDGSGTACVTPGGLVLRARGRGTAPPGSPGAGQQGSGSLRAISVAYGPQPAALFVPPAGYQRLDLAHIPGLSGGPGR